MWEKQAETREQAQQKLLRPRAAHKERDQEAGADGMSLLFVQIILCVLIGMLVLAAKVISVPFLQNMSAEYERMLSQGVGFSAENPIVRFASTTVDGIRQEAQSLVQQAGSENGGLGELLDGKGGIWPAAKKEVPPDGASFEDYVLPQPLARPVTGVLTSGYGYRDNPVTGEDDFHAGIDLAAVAGTPVGCALAGQVYKTGYNRYRGNYVLVRHADGVQTLYQHLACAAVRAGETVAQGQTIGMVGSTGLVTGPHLHFELLLDGVLVDPLKSLPGAGAA